MPPESTRVEIDRARLHRAVWAKPVPKAAEALRVTPPMLRRMVKILDVPLPGRGNWMNGHKPRAEPLPPREDGGPESVWLVPGRRHLVLEHDPQAAKRDAAPAAVPEGLHPIVERAARHYARPLLGSDGTMRPRTSAAPSLRVSVEQREWAILFADRLLKRLDKEGCSATWSGPIRLETPDGEVELTLREETEAVERPPTPAEAERRGDRLTVGGPKRYCEERPTGRLVLKVRDPLHRADEPHEWRDEGRRTLEKRVGEVARELLAYAQAKREIEDAEQTRDLARERERAREEEERRAMEQEEARRARLDAEIAAWERAATIRRYADGLEAAHRALHGGELTVDLAEWLAWMRRHADAVDPTVSIGHVEGG